jgi:hypothetical protein
LVDRDYRHTEDEIMRMLAEANRAREALGDLTQDLTRFNLENYRQIEGRHSLDELGRWARSAVLRVGGGAVPDGEFWTFHTPEPLQHRFHLAPRYERVCFDRELAMRTRNSELGGIGHPLIDTLLNVTRRPAFSGETSRIADGETIVARYLIQYDTDDNRITYRIITLRGTPDGAVEPIERFEWLGTASSPEARQKAAKQPNIATLAKRFDEMKNSVILEWIPDRHRRARVTSQLVGLHFQ